MQEEDLREDVLDRSKQIHLRYPMKSLRSRLLKHTDELLRTQDPCSIKGKETIYLLKHVFYRWSSCPAVIV